MFILLSQAYPISDFASSADLQFQTITGDAGFRCAVSSDHHLSVCNRISSFFPSVRSWANSSAKMLLHGYIGTTRETPLQNGQVLGTPLRIGWCSKGPVLGTLYASFFQCFSSKIFICIPDLMDRHLSAQWHQPRMPSLQNWLPIGSHLSVLATLINTDCPVHLSGLCTKVLHALFYSKAQVLQRLSAVVL